MIRRLNESEAPPVATTDSAFPALDQPFVLEERSPGVRFYISRTSWFHPYALLQNMSYTADSLKLVFADTDVVIRGRGLHELYRRLAEHRVACVVEQGQHHAAADEATTCISRIEHSTRLKKKTPASADAAPASEPDA
jgi:hypothetical protein